MNTPKTMQSLEYRIERVHKQHDETELAAIQRMVNEMAKDGWEVVEACGDEIRMPSLIFVNNSDASTAEYLTEIVPHVQKHSEIDDIRDALINRHDEGWIVMTVLDSPLSPPLAIYKKSTAAEASDPKIVVLPVSILENSSATINHEIVQQQLRSNCRLRTIMHAGLLPVLIFLADTGQPEYEYHVEHARGGFFVARDKKLSDLINMRAKEGWRVCGAFEDESLLPCVVFYKD